MVVDITTEPALDSGEPRLLFPLEGQMIFMSGHIHRYDISADGQRFLMVDPADRGTINVVVNWFEELKERVPTGR